MGPRFTIRQYLKVLIMYKIRKFLSMFVFYIVFAPTVFSSQKYLTLDIQEGPLKWINTVSPNENFKWEKCFISIIFWLPISETCCVIKKAAHDDTCTDRLIISVSNERFKHESLKDKNYQSMYGTESPVKILKHPKRFFFVLNKSAIHFHLPSYFQNVLSICVRYG